MAYHLTSLGWAYIAVVIVWTVLLLVGSAFLFYHRNLPCLQIRRLPVMFTGVWFLHMYAVVAWTSIAYVSIFPCSVEFWIMSIWFPFGMAMFHAANSQFLYIATRQKQFAQISALDGSKPIGQKDAEQQFNSRFGRLVQRYLRGNRIDRMMTYIGIGITIEFLLTLFVFLGSRKFHSSYGIFDYTVMGTGLEARFNCGKGWEWWLSIVWQLAWSWIYAPYMLWKTRDIQDVHCWRIQTICCCIVGLYASPLWLAGLYSPAFAAVNNYWMPQAWLASSIFFLEVFTIGFPIVQVLKTNSLREDTINAIADWEKRQEKIQLSGGGSTTAASDAYSKKTAIVSVSESSASYLSTFGKRTSTDSIKSELFNMTALEHALQTNPGPLLHFAALKDFSGENVSFLTHLAEWKSQWSMPAASLMEQRRQQFVGAVCLYASFVSLDLSEFPINISSREMRALFNIFENAAVMMIRCNSLSSDSATPFDAVDPADHGSTTDLKSGINLESLGRANLKAVEHMSGLGRVDALADAAIPESFTPGVFASAEREIKYLVLTNTWPKFVNASCVSSEASLEEVKPSWWARRGLCGV